MASCDREINGQPEEAQGVRAHTGRPTITPPEKEGIVSRWVFNVKTDNNTVKATRKIVERWGQ